MSEKDRETGSDAPEKASEQETQAPANATPGGGAAERGGSTPEQPPAGGAGAASEGAAAADAAQDEARAKAIAEAKAKAIAAARAKAEAAKAAKPKAEGAAKGKHEPAGDQPPWMVDPVVPEWKDESDDDLVRALRDAHPGAIQSARSYAGDLSLTVTREGILELASSLKEEHGYRYVVDVAGSDYPTRPERFEVVYHVYNHALERRVRLKVSTDEATPVPSLTGVWRGANWPEREAYDMFGIRFANHPDLTRILLWEGFNGYPLRKEFPVEGIDTGSAIYPEYYEEGQGPISGTGTGWKPKPPEDDSSRAGDDPDGKSEENS